MLDLSPAEWLERLDERLELRRADILEYERYYRGDHNLSYSTDAFVEMFGDMFAPFADNFCQLVCDIPVDRLKIEQFEFANKRDGLIAQKYWEENDLEALALRAHTEAVKCREAYLLVSPAVDGHRVTVEHPIQAIVEVSPEDDRVRLAGLKKWSGGDGFMYANVYLPDAVYKFRADESNAVAYMAYSAQWEPRPDEPVVDNPYGAVSLIPLRNNPGLLTGCGSSDLDVAIPVQDAINKFISNLILSGEFAALPQRVIMADFPKDADGNVDVDDRAFQVAKNRLLLIDSLDGSAKIDQFDAANLSGYVELIGLLVGHLATQTRIPPQYLLAGDDFNNVGADAMDIVESGFVAKVKRKQDDFTPAWREVMRLVTGKIGKPVWAKPERQSFSQLADALGKLQGFGVPNEWLWKQLPGVTPEDVDSWSKRPVEPVSLTG